jgi:hypothetical protein
MLLFGHRELRRDLSQLLVAAIRLARGDPFARRSHRTI